MSCPVATAPRVRTLLLKCIIDQPDALVVDLSELSVRDPVALSIFAAVARQAALWPGTPLMLSVPQGDASQLLTGDRYGRLAVFRSLDEALAAERRQTLRSVSDSLLPVSGAARRARELAAEACSLWELPQLTDPAAVVAGELVTNAVDHAQTMIDLRISVNRRYLQIAVWDGAVTEPRFAAGDMSDPQAGRGLLLVQAMAQRWGSIPIDGGKVVWASLSLHGAPTP
ncbi:MAG: ATP-binding protein [Actinoplanes sp.]